MIRLAKLLVVVVAFGVVAVLPSLSTAQDDDQGAWDDAPAAASQSVDVNASDFKLDPSALTVASGAVTFVIHNQGVIDHNLAIETSPGHTLGGSTQVAAGTTGTFDVTLPPGTYTMVCTLPAHREAGMVGTLTVTP